MDYTQHSPHCTNPVLAHSNRLARIDKALTNGEQSVLFRQADDLQTVPSRTFSDTVK